jgi:syntaxin 16
MVKSIYSLNTLYKELQSLVIEQGSLLDRIDENIDNTVESTIQANKHLQSVLII